MRKKFLLLMAVTTLIFNTFAPNIVAEEKIEVIFSETFEGDLSRWELTGTKAGKNISIDTSRDSYSGAFASIEPEFSLASASADAPEMRSPLIDVVHGEKYTFAVDINSNSAHKAQIVFFSNGSIVQGFQDCIFNPGKDEWSCSYTTIDIPDSATQMQIRLTCKTEGTVLRTASYDNVIVCKGRVMFNKDIGKRKAQAQATDDSETVLKSENVIFRDTFERKTDEWTSLDPKPAFEITSDDAATGKKSLLLTKESMKPAVSISSKSFTAIPNAEYTLSFDAINTTQNNANVHLRFFDAENKQILSESITTTSKSWKNYISTVTVPANAKTTQIYIVTGNDSGKNYIDNIKVTSNKNETEITEPTKEPEDNTSSKYEEIRKNSTILLIGSPNAIVNGEKNLIDSTNDKVVADIVDSRTLVPVRFIAETYNADVLWDARGLIVITDEPALDAEKDIETIDKLLEDAIKIS